MHFLILKESYNIEAPWVRQLNQCYDHEHIEERNKFYISTEFKLIRRVKNITKEADFTQQINK
jgi:hypothetical protein